MTNSDWGSFFGAVTVRKTHRKWTPRESPADEEDKGPQHSVQGGAIAVAILWAKCIELLYATKLRHVRQPPIAILSAPAGAPYLIHCHNHWVATGDKGLPIPLGSPGSVWRLVAEPLGIFSPTRFAWQIYKQLCQKVRTVIAPRVLFHEFSDAPHSIFNTL